MLAGAAVGATQVSGSGLGTTARISSFWPGRPMLDHVSVPSVLTPVVALAGDEKPVLSTLRVLHVVNGEHFAGAERVQSHLGRCLPRFGIEADFAFVKPGKFAQMLADQDGQWGRGHNTPMKRRLDLRPAWRVRDLVIEHHYGLLHAHTPRTALIASIASRLTGVPWIYHIHSPAVRDSDNQWSNRVNAMIEKQSVRGCSHMIAVSESLRLDCICAEHWRKKSVWFTTAYPRSVPIETRFRLLVVAGRLEWLL